MKIPNFATRLEAELKARGMTQEMLAEKAKVSGRHVSRMKKEDDISEVYLRKICKALDMDIFDFINDMPLKDSYFPVPIREAGGGMGGGYLSGSKKITSYISLRRDFLLSKTGNIDALSFIHASGESMAPTIPNDAVVLIDESQTEPINNKIFYIMFNNAFLIKRLEVKDGKVIALISDNGRKREELGAQDNFEILGKAILQQTLL